jgi:hypothetical protein
VIFFLPQGEIVCGRVDPIFEKTLEFVERRWKCLETVTELAIVIFEKVFSELLVDGIAGA